MNSCKLKHRSFLLTLISAAIPIVVPLVAGSFISYSARALNSQSDEIFLSIGRTVNWPVNRGSAVSVSNGAIVHVVDQGRFLKISGRKIGTASILAGSKRIQVTVLPEPSYRVFEKLEVVIEESRGLVIEQNRGTEHTATAGDLQVRGRLLRFSDWLKLADRARGISSGAYVFAAQLEPTTAAAAQTYFRSLLAQASLPDLDFQLEPVARVIIPSDPPDLKDRVAQVLAPYGFRMDLTPSALTLDALVRVHIVVAEVKKTALTQFGIEWPAAVDGQLLPKPAFPIDGSLGVSLHALEAKGWGQVLASPTLLCRSGKEATFLAGGEFPIKIVNFKTQDVVWKKYGVLLKIQPRADFSGRMRIGLETEVSMIDTAHTVDGIPGLLTNRIETHFDLSSSRTIALSGLIKKEWGESMKGLPGLGGIPILGPLFSSQEYRDDRSELIIFVTPEVVRPDQEGK